MVVFPIELICFLGHHNKGSVIVYEVDVFNDRLMLAVDSSVLYAVPSETDCLKSHITISCKWENAPFFILIVANFNDRSVYPCINE